MTRAKICRCSVRVNFKFPSLVRYGWIAAFVRSESVGLLLCLLNAPIDRKVDDVVSILFLCYLYLRFRCTIVVRNIPSPLVIFIVVGALR